ncbi:MAG: PKD domain-containing protein [Saprospiraceae bacterium]
MTLNPTPVCGPATISKTITILEPPTANATAQSSNSTGCAPLTVTFDNLSTGYQVSYNWSVNPPAGWNFISNTTNTSENPVIRFDAAGTYTVTLTTGNVCSTDTWDTTIIVRTLPSITLPTLGPYCQTASLCFDAGNATYNNGNGTISSYSWSFPGGTPSSSNQQFPCNINYSVTAATTFNVSVTVTNQCGSATAGASFEVQVPPVLTMPPNLTLCLNANPVQLNAIPGNGAWSGPGVNATGLFNPANAGGPGAKTLTYTYGIGVCQATATMTVTVVPLPSVNAGPDLSACVNESALQLSGATPTPGNWTSNPMAVINSNIFNPMASGAGTYTLTYTHTDANNCTNTDTRTVTVHPLPIVTVGNASYCNTPGLVPLPTATPPGGTWSGLGVSGNQFNPVAVGVGTHTITYTYTNSSTGCTNTAVSTITVSNPSTINAGPDTAVCINAAPLNLNNGVSPPNGDWSTTSNGLSNGVFTPSLAGAGTHTLTYTFGSGNCLVTDTRVITVFALPAVNAGADQTACVDVLSVTLSPTPPNGVWSGSGVYANNVFNPNQSGPGTYNLTYTFTDGNSCVNNDGMTITVHPLPVVHTNDTSYCNTPGVVSLPVATPPGGTWSGQGISNNQFNPVTAGGVGTYTAVYTYTNANNCTNRDTISITVINPDNVNAGIDTAFCVSVTSFDLNASVTPAGGIWSSSGPGLSGNIFNPNAAGPGTYTLTYSVGTGNCLVQDTRTIIVRPLPVVQAGSDLSACVDTTALNLSPNPAGGAWTGNGVYTGNVFNPNQSGDGTFNLTYTFTDANGCTNADGLTINVHPLPVVSASDTAYCDTPGAIGLPFANPANGVWTGAEISNNQFDPQAAGGVGTYPAVYTYTDGNGCKNTDTILIEVISPANVNAGVDTAFCESVTAFDLGQDALPAAGGTWTSTGGGLQGPIFNPNAAGPGIYTLTYSVGAGNCLVQDTRTIEVRALPLVEAGPDLSACSSDSTLDLGGIPIPGVWTSFPTAVINGNTWNPALSGVNTYTLTFTHMDANGCINSDQRTAVVHPLPVPLAGDTTYCNTPGTVLLPFATPLGGSWNGAGISGLQFDPQGAGGIGAYPATYVYTDNYNCTDSITVLIEVIDPPFIYAGVNDTICINGGALQLTGFEPATNGFWSGNGIINAQTGVFDPELAGGGNHPLTYTFGSGNCQVKDTAEIFVIAVAIDAGPDHTICLDDNPLLLSGFTPAGGVWSGVGITNPIGVFTPSVATVGTHVLYYKYNDPILDCIFRDSVSITVHPMPESDFAPPTNSCIDVVIPFVNQSQSTFMPLWTFGAGAGSTEANPTHVYTDTGTYLVTLVTENQFGCIDSISRTIFVTSPPTAFFSTAPDSGCAVLQVNFMNTSFGFETTYTWDFGNGDTSTLYDPGTISFQQGTGDTIYHIRLTAQNLCATREWLDSVKVFPWPQVAFGINLDTICTGAFIEFSNTTLGKPEFFFWDFGNGVTSTDTVPYPVQFFTDTLYRTYNITLIATNFCGSDTAVYPVVVKPVDVRAFFNIPNDTGCEPYTVTFTNYATLGAPVTWDFGDGNTSSANSPTHTFTSDGVFKVVQKVSSGCGYDSTIAYITVLLAPDVSFSSAPQVCRNAPLQFTNTSVSPLSGTIWSFGDGDSSLLYNPAHSWTQIGSYNITLIGISAINGCPATAAGTVNVLELPVIQFMPSQLDGCIPLTIAFSNQSQGATYFEWDFGDNNTQLGATPSHTYTAAGQYAVHLRGIDLNGCRNDTTFYYITAHPIPSPAFAMDRDRLCGLPVSVQMQNQTPDAISYSWDLGNGSTSVQNNPTTTYTAAGDYTVQLIAVNTFGCRDTTQSIFSAYAIPEADFQYTPDDGCDPLTVQFENLSRFSTNAYWRFSNGGVSTEFSPAYIFHGPGSYGAQLIASHRDVCFDTLQLDDIIWVEPSPVANFTFVEILTMPPSGIFKFTDASLDAIQWDWEFGDGGESDAQNPEHRYFSNGPKMVTLLVTSPNGCTDDTSQVVIPTGMKGLFIPNAFTPTAGVGDVTLFKPKGVGLKEYEIEVYSPYGQLLWRSDQLNEGQPAEAWDGTFQGQLLPQDVYTWKVTRAVFEDGTLWPGNFDAGTGAGKWVGSVTLIR